MDKTPLYKIDYVLNLINKAEQPPYRTFTELKGEIEIDISTKELMEILHKLEFDRNCYSEISDSDNIKRYYSSFEGRLLGLRGSYTIKNVYKKIKNIVNALMIALTITNIFAIIYLTNKSNEIQSQSNETNKILKDLIEYVLEK